MAFYIGVEKVINGSFDYNTNWEKNTGWTIDSGVATADGSTNASHLYQNIQLNSLKTYAYSFDYVASVADGQLKMQGYDDAALYYDIVTLDAENGETGGHVEGEFTASSLPNGYIYFQMVQGNAACWAGTVDNVQVRELKLVMDNEKTSYFVNVAPSFKFRTIISYAFTAGGYCDSDSWKDCYQTVVATDQTTHLGQLLQKCGGYVNAANNNINMFVFGTEGDTQPGPQATVSTYTSAFSMITNTQYTHQAAFDMLHSRNDNAVIWKEAYFAWIFGGQAITNYHIQKFDLTNETMLAVTQSSSYIDGDTMQLAATSFTDENFGYVWDTDAAILYNMTTEVESSSTQWGIGSQQKGMSSKNRKGWCGNDGTYSGGYSYNRWDLTTNTLIGTMNKPYQGTGAGTGEENYTMGQDHQYMIGCYDGLQSNHSHKFDYTTETGVVNSTGLSPAVNTGMSSGTCGWRS